MREQVIVAGMPKLRAAMHLDTIFTFADRDCVTIYPDIVHINTTSSERYSARVEVTHETRPFLEVVRTALGLDVCAPSTPEATSDTERQQWDSGNNLVAIAGRLQLSPQQLSKAGISAAYARLTDLEPDLDRCIAEASSLTPADRRTDCQELARLSCRWSLTTCCMARQLLQPQHDLHDLSFGGRCDDADATGAELAGSRLSARPGRRAGGRRFTRRTARTARVGMAARAGQPRFHDRPADASAACAAAHAKVAVWLALLLLLVAIYAVVIGLVAVLVFSIARLAGLLPAYSAEASRVAAANLGRAAPARDRPGPGEFGASRARCEPAGWMADRGALLGGGLRRERDLPLEPAVVHRHRIDRCLATCERTSWPGRDRAPPTALRGFAHKSRRFIGVTTIFALIVRDRRDTVFLILIGIPLAAVWGLLAAVCNYIPYVGFIIEGHSAGSVGAVDRRLALDDHRDRRLHRAELAADDAAAAILRR